MARYRVTHVQHFIGGRIRPVGEVLTLPEGVKPGRYLELVADEPKLAAKPKQRELPDA